MSPSTSEVALNKNSPPTPKSLPMPNTLYESYCRPQLGMLLRFLGLDVEYFETSGDCLVAIDREGSRREVWDFLGGFGSTILGHNPDVIADELARLVARKVPVHAQASARVEAGKLAASLNELLTQSLGLAPAFAACPSPPPPPRFFSLFVSTGTEAVEAAIKHALMAWATRRDELLVRIDSAMCALLQENDDEGGRGGGGGGEGGGESRSGSNKRHPPSTRLSQLLAALDDSARRLVEASPIFLAVRGSYHGRTAGSLAVTGNASYGAMYNGRSAIEARFLPRDPGEGDIEQALAECRLEGLVLPPSPSSSAKGSPSSSKSSPLCSFSRVAACFVEWIQGEGGMRPMPERSARALSRALRREQVPLVADEIQTGLFRTGTLLASEHYNDLREKDDSIIVPDYVLLGKALGGGYAKLAAVCIRDTCYEPEFGRLHSSTFADDDLSCAIGLRVLEELCGAGPRRQQRWGGKGEEIRARAESFEAAVRSSVACVQRRHPGVVREVRGRGFMLGVELDVDLGGTAPVLLQALNQTGMTPYALCSWLLNRRGVRVGATLNDEGDGSFDETAVEKVKAPTLRIEPSAFVSAEAVSALVGALEEMCGLLHGRRLAELLGPVLRQDRLPAAAAFGTATTTAVGVRSFSSSSTATSTSHVSFSSSSSSSRFSSPPHPLSPCPLWSVVSPPRPPPIPFSRSGPVRKAVFLSHLIDERHVAALDPALRSFLSPARRKEFFSEASPLAGSSVYHEQLVTFGGGSDGSGRRRGGKQRQILLQLRGVFATSEFFERSARAQDGLACQKVAEAARVAVGEGADVVGLGQFTSIVTQNGVALLPRPAFRGGDNGFSFHGGGSGGSGCGGGGGGGWDNDNALVDPTRSGRDRRLRLRRPATLTTGNSLTVGLAYRALLGLLRERGKTLAGSRVAVIGAAGNICRTYAELLAADGVGSLLLVHREPLEASPKFREAHRRVCRAAAEAVASRTGVSNAAAAEAAAKKVEATHLLDPIAGCDIVVSGTNSTRQFLEPIHLARGAVVLDVSVPSNVSRGVLTLRPDVECFQGANATLPAGQKLLSPLVPTDDGNVFACMGETVALAMIMALEDDEVDERNGAHDRRRRQSLRGGSHSVGALSREGVIATLEMADRVGIGLGRVKRMSNAEAAAVRVAAAEGTDKVVPTSRL
jgi:acetylornithine/succinyldiaminopimelate/putrescine aminotransferase/predicted amino acid dehydrogenase